jgi:hypothetical protein
VEGSGGCGVKVVRSKTPSIEGILSNSILSFKATGLLLVVLSQQDHEGLDFKFLRDVKNDGSLSVLSGLSELEREGYLLYFRWRDGQGRWESEYVFFETPQLRDEYLRMLSGEEKQRLSVISKPTKRGAA